MPNTSATGGFLTPVDLNSAIDDAELDAVFQQYVSGVTSLTGDLVRPRWQPTVPKQPEPSVTWCSVGVVADSQDSYPYFGHNPNADGGLGRDEMIRHEVLQVMATFYGSNAKRYAKILRDGFNVEQNNWWFRQYGIAFQSCDNIRAVPELVNQQWVRRYDLAFFVKRCIIRTYEVKNIATADITINSEMLSNHILIQE